MNKRHEADLETFLDNDEATRQGLDPIDLDRSESTIESDYGIIRDGINDHNNTYRAMTEERHNDSIFSHILDNAIQNPLCI